MPTKCGMRRSPPVVLHPVSGMPGPPSGTPTACAPITPRKVPSPSCLVCSAVGRVISAPRPIPTRDSTAPDRRATRVAASAIGLRTSSTVRTNVPVQITAIEAPMTANRVVFNGVPTLKWLVVPRTTWVTMIAYSTSARITIVVDTRHAVVRRRGSSEYSQDQVRQ